MLGLTLPLVQTAQAAEIYYARAIGHEFLPETAPAAPAPKQADRQPELPGLGAGAEDKKPAPQMSGWSKVLIGVLVVGTIAALGSRGGGGSGGESSATDSGTSGSGSTPPPPPSSGSGSGGSGGGGGGGGISIGIGGGRR